MSTLTSLGAARHLVTFCRQPSKALQALRSQQEQNGKNNLELVFDVATLWNSTFMTSERLCCLQVPVRQVLSNPHGAHCKTWICCTFGTAG